MAQRRSAPAANADRVLVITRTFDAPAALVWACWTDPVHGKAWGPDGFTIAQSEGDVRVGGAWRACLRPDDGGPDLWQGGVYQDVAPHERLAFTFAWEDENGIPGHWTLITLSFEEKDGRTTMTFRQEGFESTPSRDGHRSGWTGAFDKMAQHIEALAAQSSAKSAP